MLFASRTQQLSETGSAIEGAFGVTRQLTKKLQLFDYLTERPRCSWYQCRRTLHNRNKKNRRNTLKNLHLFNFHAVHSIRPYVALFYSWGPFLGSRYA